jgi:site-specific recombinase XerD
MAELADAADLKTAPTLPTSLLINKFIESRPDGLSPNTIKDHRLYLRRSSAVVGLNVTGQDIQRFISSRPCSGGGKHANFRCLHAFYNWLYSPKSSLGLKLQDNPMLIVDAPKVEKKILPSLTPEQLEYLIDKVESVHGRCHFLLGSNPNIIYIC